MKALVTGGAGFIGSALARALVAQGHDVRVLDSFLTGRRDRVPEDTDLVEGDLRDSGVVEKACRGVEVVFHQAALRSVPKSVDEPVISAECNIMGTLNVLQAAAAAGVERLIYASSSSVYGADAHIPNREDHDPRPASPYAVSKLAGEQYCGVWTHLKGLPTVSLRYFNVFGPGQDPESKYSAVFPAFIAALLRGEAPEVHWDGEQGRDFTFVDDVVAANLAAALSSGAADGEAINIAGGRSYTVNQVLKAVEKFLGKSIDPVRTPMRAGDVRTTLADVSKAEELLGWRAEVDFEDGVERTVEWFTRQPGSAD